MIDSPTQRLEAWEDARGLWLSRQGSPNTALAYKQSLIKLLDHTKKQPWEISRRDINAWAASLQKRGLSNATIGIRLTAVRSFFRFIIRDYVLMDLDGNEYRLREDNPAEGCKGPKIEQYGKAMCLDREQAAALLQAIETTNLVGKRNKALFAGYMLLGLRSSELRQLKYEDIDVRLEGITMRYTGKGGRSQVKEIYPPVYQAIMAFANAENRYEGYVFHAFDASGKPAERPIGDQTVRDALKYYARRAGLRTQGLKVHSLRHTAATLRKEAGDTDEAIQKFLKHGNVNTTRIYLQHLKPDPDKTWMNVAEMLELVHL